MHKVIIRNELASLKDYWSQKVIAEANGQLFKVAKGIGPINWHHHDDQDELFILYDGHLTIELRTDKIRRAPDHRTQDGQDDGQDGGDTASGRRVVRRPKRGGASCPCGRRGGLPDCRLEHHIDETGRQARVELLRAGRDPLKG